MLQERFWLPCTGHELPGWQHATPSVPHAWHFLVALQNVPETVQML
jgi:hypothetical protein